MSINDQTIANYCSDTIRYLNNLTEELQYSDLDISRARQNSLGSEKKSREHLAGNSSSNENIFNNSDSYKQGRYQDNTDNENIAESSPFYTQLNQNLDNSLFNLTLNNGHSSNECPSNQHDTVDGCVLGDKDSLAECMLQSVDLEGKPLVNKRMVQENVSNL